MGWNPVCSRGAAVEADAIGEQQSKRTRSGAAADRESCEQQHEAGAIGEQQLEAEANGEQQWKRMPQSCPRAAAEANASGEQQLKPGRNRGEAALQRAVRRRITHGRRTRGPGEVAERAKRAQLLVIYR